MKRGTKRESTTLQTSMKLEVETFRCQKKKPTHNQKKRTTIKRQRDTADSIYFQLNS
jgi:hypothetical protein